MHLDRFQMQGPDAPVYVSLPSPTCTKVLKTEIRLKTTQNQSSLVLGVPVLILFFHSGAQGVRQPELSGKLGGKRNKSTYRCSQVAR